MPCLRRDAPYQGIKGRERECRSVLRTVKIKIAGRIQKCPTQWKSFCPLSETRKTLRNFWHGNGPHQNMRKSYTTELYTLLTERSAVNIRLTMGSQSTSKTSTSSVQLTIEEADTRLLLHASHAASDGYAAIVIRSPDTDEAILTFSLANQIPSHIYFRTGTENTFHRYKRRSG